MLNFISFFTIFVELVVILGFNTTTTTNIVIIIIALRETGLIN